MVSVDDAVEARITKNGQAFTILVDCEKALQYRTGVVTDINEVVLTFDVFKDSKKGLRWDEENLEKAFGTSNLEKVADEIIRNGHVNLTTEYRNKLKEQKTNQIVYIISKRAYDPKTGNPHPPKRIEGAMEQAKVNIDIFKNAEEQAKEIVEKINMIIPISMKELVYAIRIPPTFAAKAFHAFRNIGEIQNQEWQNDGSLLLELKIPAGQKDDLISKANEITRGNVEITQVK